MHKQVRYRSLLPFDISFDLRNTGHSVRIYEGFGYRYLDKNDKKALVYPDADFGSTTNLLATAEVLARAGYRVIPFKTPEGKVVSVEPLGGNSGIAWSVPNTKFFGNPMRKETLSEALSTSEWDIDDLQPLSSDEY